MSNERTTVLQDLMSFRELKESADEIYKRFEDIQKAEEYYSDPNVHKNSNNKVGFANGLRLALSILQGVKPKYMPKPKMFLQDKIVPIDENVEEND